MNLKEIAKTIRAQVEKLQQGGDSEKEFAQELAAVAQKIEAHQKAGERPITAETLKGIRIGRNKGPHFTPRRLPPRNK